MRIEKFSVLFKYFDAQLIIMIIIIIIIVIIITK